MLESAQMKLRSAALLILAFFAFAPLSRALSMNELRAMPGLTPEKFARLFAGFAYKFHAEVQPHDVFLDTKSGDCDDFATVAADVLQRRGYTPRMIAIRMKGETTSFVTSPRNTPTSITTPARKNSPSSPAAPRLPPLPRKSPPVSTAIGWQRMNSPTTRTKT